MKYLLYCDVNNPGSIYRSDPCNEGIDEVLAKTKQLRAQGIDLELMDTGKMSEEDLQTAYINSILPSVLKKYRVRHVFGSRRHAGSSFGRGVPALVVRPESDRFPEDIYPHDRCGKIVTIREVLLTGGATSGGSSAKRGRK